MRWKSRNSSPTTPSSTATMPIDSTGDADARDVELRVAEQAREAAVAEAPDPAGEAVDEDERPSVTITSVSTSPPSTGRMMTRSISIPPTNESASVPSSASAERQARLRSAPRR